MATTGRKNGKAGGIPRLKLEWLSNWARVAKPTSAHIEARNRARRLAGGVYTMSFSASCHTASIRLRAWTSTPQTRWRGPMRSIRCVAPGDDGGDE